MLSVAYERIDYLLPKQQELEHLINETQRPVISNASNVLNQNMSVHSGGSYPMVKLPQLKLPKYNGNR